MPLDWLVNPQTPAVLDRPSVLEFWPDDCQVRYDRQEVLADGSRPLYAGFEDEVIRAWREHRKSGGRYFMAFYQGRAVKGVHLPDCCSCKRCHPEWHGARGHQGPGVMYSATTGKCLCCK